MSEQGHIADEMTWRPSRFARAARRVTLWAGSWWSIIVIAILIAVWVVVGAALGFPRGWELTVTTGVPLLTLFLLIIVQHTQNHDDRAIQLKLDELIRGVDQASNSMLRIDEGSWEDLQKLKGHFQDRADEAHGD